MKLAYKMEYTHPVRETTDIKMIPYTADFQQRYKTLYNDCYRRMRTELDIRPYDYIQDDSFFAEGMDNVWLLVEGGELIGSVALKGEEIDDLLVDCRFQGRGYGRKILLWALQNRPYEHAVLHVAAWNKRAMHLYETTGFTVTETIVIGQ